ncbi:hypothetical protein [Cellulosilyticum lentocellum]|uniref:Uncharacterized protein n=1 Tax=Cellulosilyticum lentocellum (strain ATCC 49066 / DSM 5427 / NCIMB 11756 / RHM5) TaxID=642492 RepID=F2JK17_CELLD|nr:hypothetical protein [Cellulosilyticum lentocellum]ADZ84432.1 hypothetical protein Clole_2732 [Cellulosilyticum lentocellum DSM 5427]
MSTNKRKVVYYSICFTKRENSEIQVEPFFCKDRFVDFINYLRTLSHADALKDKKSQNKAISIENLDFVDQSKPRIKLIMKSCKYNHSPNYMSSRDGSERESDKKLDEGEKELTHICGIVNEEEVFLVMEERKTAIGITMLIDYLNWLYKKYLIARNLEYDHKIIYASIPDDDFLQSLNKFERVTFADVIMDKEIIGSEGLGLVEEGSDLIREEVNVTIKSTPKQSLPIRVLKGVYQRFISEGSKIRRIRVYGKDNSRADLKIDTGFFKKVRYIDVQLDIDGTVKSSDMIEKLSSLLE